MTEGRSLVIRLGSLWVGIIIIIFGGYEIAERYWLDPQNMSLLHAFHVIRGIGASLVTGLVIAIFFVKRPPRIFSIGLLGANPALVKSDQLRANAIMFVGLRWLVVIGATLASVLGAREHGFLPAEVFYPLIGCCATLAAGNVVFAASLSRIQNYDRHILFQIYFDLVILTFLLHFSGGLENPFFMIYIIHVIIAGILLSRRAAIIVTILTGLLFTGLVFLEFEGVIAHYTIGLFPHHPDQLGEVHASHDFYFVVGRSIPFVLVISVTAFFSILLRERIRRDDVRMIQAEKMSALGQFASGIAHEINNPIGIISTKTKLLLEDQHLQPKVLSDLEKIEKHTRRVAELATGLLTFCRPSLGKKEPLDLNHVMRATLELIKTDLKNKGMRVDTHLVPTLPNMMGNANEIQQMVMNLIHNAVDAMPDAGTVTLTTYVSGNGVVGLSVADTGTGIPKRFIHRIFDPFFTTKAQGKGTGLGLSITHGLVRSHRGRITVESDEGKGTTFTVEFPILGQEKKEGAHDATV